MIAFFSDCALPPQLLRAEITVSLVETIITVGTRLFASETVLFLVSGT